MTYYKTTANRNTIRSGSDDTGILSVDQLLIIFETYNERLKTYSLNTLDQRL